MIINLLPRCTLASYVGVEFRGEVCSVGRTESGGRRVQDRMRRLGVKRRGQDEIQKLTDQFIARVEKLLAEKEADLMEI